MAKTSPATTHDSALESSKWKPFSPSIYGMGRPAAVDLVKVYRSGTVRISADIVLRLGEPEKVQLLTDGDSSRFGVMLAHKAPGALTLTKGSHQHEFKANRLLTALGKAFGDLEWPLELPHSWDGNVLVIDVTEVPDAAASPATGEGA